MMIGDIVMIHFFAWTRWMRTTYCYKVSIRLYRLCVCVCVCVCVLWIYCRWFVVVIIEGRWEWWLRCTIFVVHKNENGMQYSSAVVLTCINLSQVPHHYIILQLKPSKRKTNTGLAKTGTIDDGWDMRQAHRWFDDAPNNVYCSWSENTRRHTHILL